MNGIVNTADIAGAIPLAATGRDETSIFDYIHSWLVTVDHKRLGLMYLMYGLLFLVVAGIEAA